MRRGLILALVGVLLAAVFACRGTDGESAGPVSTATSAVPSTSAPGAAGAAAIAENMLVAYNSGDYQAFSRDWSGPMKLVIRENAFRKFRDENVPVTGRFTSLTSVAPTPGTGDTDHASYDVLAKFERRDAALFTMTLSADGAKVEGIEFRRPS